MVCTSRSASAEVADGRRADVESHQVRRDRPALHDASRGGVGRGRDHRVDGQAEVDAAPPRHFEETASCLDQVCFEERSPDLVPLGAEERERHPAATRSRSTRPRSDSIRASLSETLAPPRMAASGRAGASKIRARRGELLRHQEPGHRGPEVARDPLGRGMGPVGRRERVAHVDVAEPRERPGEWGVVRFLARVEAQVLEKQDAPGGSAAAWASTADPTQSGARGTGAPSSAPSRRATGARENLASGPPFGRPRCGRRPSRARRASGRAGESAGRRGCARPRSPRRPVRAGR